jgi:membrane-bound serine protease (ClpP class)
MPVSYAGLALLVLGLGLMVAEAFSPTLGVLGVGGLVAFVVGSLFLFDAEDLGGFDYGVAWPTIAAASAASALFFFAVLGAAIKARRRPVVTGIEEMLGSTGEVLDWQGESGLVRLHGETWQARLIQPGTIAPGDTVRVVRLDGLTAVVEPAR